MWTPRRVLLFVIGFAIVAAGFSVYLWFLGSYDGLPALPPAYLQKGDASTPVPSRPVPTTIGLLQMAFGKNSPEGGADARVYMHRLPITGRNGVMAIGPPRTDSSPRVVVSPVSLALFGQRNPRPKPGEQVETTTLHADRAVIIFDKPITRVEDMSGAKVVSMNLESDPDDDPKAVAVKRDSRKGRTWISNNRKSADPSDHLVVRTVGPLFVELPDESIPYKPETKHIWTAAAVEVFDRRNLPRTLRARDTALSKSEWVGLSAVGELTADEPVPPLAAPVSPEDLRRHDAVKDILTGRTLPPPTAVARGLEVYLAPAKKDANAPPPPPGKGNSSFAGVREMVMGDGVQLCLWTEGGGGFPGTTPTPAAPQPSGKPADPPGLFADPPLGALALGGGLIDAGVIGDRLASRSLLVVSTPGQFRYDLEHSFATFTSAAHAPDAGGNFVVATRLNAANQTDDLVCAKLTLDLTDPNNPNKGGGGVVVRELTASGPQVYAAVQADGLDAACVELRHTRGKPGQPNLTVLRGTADTPVSVKQNGGRLSAGDPATAAVVTITDPPPGPDGKRRSTVNVSGPGRLELTDRDPETGTPRTSVAQWAKGMDQEKVDKGGRVLDLFTLKDDAAFVDAANNFSLRSKEIKVWVGGKDGPEVAKPSAAVGTPAAGGKPELLIATTDVHLDSPDLVVRQTNKLTVFFADIPPPKLPAKKDEPAPLPVPRPLAPEVPPPAALPPVLAPKPAEPKAEPKPPAEPIPNPMQLQADVVEAWMGRYPVPPPPGAKDATPRTKYELQKARCDGGVAVHQDPDPNDPQRPANGLDITGVKLLLENAGPDGSVLTVYGREVTTGESARAGWAKVAFEDTVIFGPVVVIDQPNNVASVAGSGQLQSLTASDVAGNDLSSPSRLVIDWGERMKFEGAKSSAVFVGKVAVQQEAKADKPPAAKAPVAYPVVPVGQREELPKPREAGTFTPTDTLTQLWCHQLDLTLDRPVYFNQLRKEDRGRKPTDEKTKTAAEPKPKVKLAVATANPDGAKPEERRVLFRETATTSKEKEVVRARLLVAKRMDFTNRTKEQELFAVGPGQLRLLQPHKSDAPADPKAPPAGEMKLTVVNFQSTMNGKDEGGLYQEATFDKGGTVLRTPTKDLGLDLEPHTLPKGGEYLRSEDTLVVSASKPKKDGEAEQRLIGTGNAEFRDESRTGVGDKIVFDGTRVTLEAGVGRLAGLYANKRAVENQQNMRAKKFVYNTATGVVDVDQSAGGSLLPGGR